MSGTLYGNRNAKIGEDLGLAHSLNLSQEAGQQRVLILAEAGN